MKVSVTTPVWGCSVENLIGIAKLANPVLKKETDSFTFKIKLDL